MVDIRDLVMVVVAVMTGGLIAWSVAGLRSMRRMAELTDEIEELERERDELTQERERTWYEKGVLLEKMVELAQKPPVVIPSPDPAPLIAAISEAITAVYAPGPAESAPTLPRETENPAVDPTTTQWFPDQEFDEWLSHTEGYPTKGGWVNPQTNSQANLPDGQRPVHGLREDGTLMRLDGQPMFRAGDGQVVGPEGGIE